MSSRLALGAVGVVVALLGAYQLLGLGLDNLAGTLVWLAGGVVLHDGVLAFATIAIARVGALLVPRDLRAPLAAALLVIGTVTLAAVPVLGRFGARRDNPTLLDRDYGVGWLLLVAFVAVVTAARVVLGRRFGTPRRNGDSVPVRRP